MKKSSGFTILESMISLVLLAFAVVGAFSFFIFQSAGGFDSSRRKFADENVFLTQAILTRDIMHAGYGVALHPELAVYVRDNLGVDGSDELYLNYTNHLTADQIPEGLPNAAALDLIKAYNVFFDGRTDLYKGVFSIPGTATSAFPLPALPKTTTARDIGAFICSSGAATAPVPYRVEVNVATAASTGQNAQLTDRNDWNFPLLTAATPTHVATPAISYKLGYITVDNEQVKALWRNGGNLVGTPVTPLLGGEPFFQVRDLQVRLQFADGSWASAYYGTGNQTPANLRLVEVTVRYQARRKGFSKAQFDRSLMLSRIVSASPRTISVGR